MGDEPPRKVAHRHALRFKGFNELKVDDAGDPVMEFVFCPICNRVPNDNELVGWHFQ